MSVVSFTLGYEPRKLSYLPVRNYAAMAARRYLPFRILFTRSGFSIIGTPFSVEIGSVILTVQITPIAFRSETTAPTATEKKF